MSTHAQNAKIQDFVRELSGFAVTAENTLKEIEADLEGQKHKFSIFSERMFAIRGTAQQLQLEEIAKIAGLGEEIAVKGTTAAPALMCASAWEASGTR